MKNNSHEKWMRIALEEAEKALNEKELPIGGVLVSNGKLIARSQTQVRRRQSMAAHSELLILLDSKGLLFTAQHPLVMYSTLEPCIMCLGAMIQCGIDELVYGMRCAPDGGTSLAGYIANSGQKVPKITSGVLEKECVSLFRKWPHPPDHPAYKYVQAILDVYR